ncbi:cytochrome D1 domain-containing protein [Azospirillum sp. sgz301742]
MMHKLMLTGVLAASLIAAPALAAEPRGTNDMGIVVERAIGKVLVVETTGRTVLGEVAGLGDLSHAAAVFSRDGRYAYVFGRDGGLSKVDILTNTLVKRVMQAGNSIGGSISQDGTLIAVQNYEPGGVKIFDADTLDQIADIPATYGEGGARSKVVGLADAPGKRFVWTLYDAGEIWVADLADPKNPQVRKFKNVGTQPYDALITPDGRHYIAGLFGEDGLALLDLWNLDTGVRRILNGYGKGDPALPVFKMPHLRGWGFADGKMFLPAIGRHEVLVVDSRTWTEVGRIPVKGQPVFVMPRPDGRQVWVNFALPDNGFMQVIDVPSLSVQKTLEPGPGVLHFEFTPRGETVWVSVRDQDRVRVYDTATLDEVSQFKADKPSGILFTARANKIGL